MNKTMIRFMVTLIITCFYCMVWIGLELMIDGVVTDRIVDNIIMLLFMPVIYIATTKFIK